MASIKSSGYAPIPPGVIIVATVPNTKTGKAANSGKPAVSFIA